MNINSLSYEESLTENIYFAQISPAMYRKLCAEIAINVFLDDRIRSVLTRETNGRIDNFLFSLVAIIKQKSYSFSELIKLNEEWVSLIGHYQMTSETNAYMSQNLLDILYYTHESLIDDPRKSALWLIKAVFRIANQVSVDITDWINSDTLSTSDLN